MIPKPQLVSESARLWFFASCEFNEFSRELRANGKLLDLESKPLDVLVQLLQHAGEVLSKEELLEAVWPGVTVVESSLATAISKLRKVLSDALGEEAQPIIVTIPRTGYRIGVPVQVRHLTAAAVPAAALGFSPGDPVPGRDQWQLLRNLDTSASSEVWLAEHPKTGEQRVFKFAADGVRLNGLKREVTLARLLRESLGERPEFVRLLEWNFETPPYYLESEYSGPNLAEWAERQGGLANVPLDERVNILLEIARAVAAAHGIGVLHKDLKPANVLVAQNPDGGRQTKVADFGSGGLMDPGRLAQYGITNLGFTRTSDDHRTGTILYLAPEVLAGHAPTAAADVYALGVILYQLVAGDFRKSLLPGWESDVQDRLLREDIANAACGDFSRRLSTVAALIERIETLEQRRTHRDELQIAEQRALFAERKLAAAQARRPWVIAALVTLIAGLATSLVFYRRAAEERDRANYQTAIAGAMNRFLVTDLLGHSDPFRGGASGETLVDAVKAALPRIDRQFGSAPEVAARLHHAAARAFDNRSNYPEARSEYQRASELYGPTSQDAIIANLQRAAMDARSFQQGSVPGARMIVEQQEARLGQMGPHRPEVDVWLASARGMIALISNDAKQAAAQFQAAADRAQQIPSFDASARLTLKQRQAFSNIRLGDGSKAERLFRELINAFSQTDGPESANVLRVRLNLAQAFMIQGKNKEAIAETRSLYPLFAARLGETHELTLQLLTTQAQCEGAAGLWDDAIRDDLNVYNAAMKKQGPTSFFAIASLSDAALAQCRAAKYRDGEVNARKAYDQARKAFGPAHGLTGGAADTLATCLIGINQLPEASRLLESIDSDAVAQLTGFPAWSANVALAQAEIAYREGDVTTAREKLAIARPALMRPDAEPYTRRQVEKLGEALAAISRK